MNDEGRRYPRYSIPILIEAPALSGHPLVPEDISHNGFRVEVSEEPRSGDLIECSFAVNGKLFDGRVARVEWVKGNEIFSSSWSVGLSMEAEGTRQEDFIAALDAVFKNLGKAP